MDIDTNKIIENSIRDGIREGIKAKLSASYGSPLEDIIKRCLETNSKAFRDLFEGAIATCISDAAFVEEIRCSVRHVLAKTLVQRFGGELEKQVNVLKSDPTTRARITLAIEEIVKQKA